MLFFLTSLFSEKSQAFQHRAVGDREDDRRLFLRHVFELVPLPRRNEEAVPWAPGKIISNALFLADRRYPLSLHDVVNRAARMTVRLGLTANLFHNLFPSLIYVGCLTPETVRFT